MKSLCRYQAARASGRKLASRLGAGWKARVWENLGWYYCAWKGGLTVYEDRGVLSRPAYTVGFNQRGGVGSQTFWSVSRHFRSPEAAVAAQLRAARAFVAQCQRAIDQVEATRKVVRATR